MARHDLVRQGLVPKGGGGTSAAISGSHAAFMSGLHVAFVVGAVVTLGGACAGPFIRRGDPSEDLVVAPF